MPINIYNEDTKESIARLCDNNWILIDQFNEFERWISVSVKSLDPSESYIADIGFSANGNARAGGPAFHIELMKILIEYKVNVYISEYPPLINDSYT